MQRAEIVRKHEQGYGRAGRKPEKWAGLSRQEADEIQQRCEAALRARGVEVRALTPGAARAA
jgi:hypothetical protein